MDVYRYPLEAISEYGRALHESAKRKRNTHPQKPSNKLFFYLVVKGDDNDSKIATKDVQSFFRSGVNAGEVYVFIFIDITTDLRLSNDMRGVYFGVAQTYMNKLQICVLYFL